VRVRPSEPERTRPHGRRGGRFRAGAGLPGLSPVGCPGVWPVANRGRGREAATLRRHLHERRAAARRPPGLHRRAHHLIGAPTSERHLVTHLTRRTPTATGDRNPYCDCMAAESTIVSVNGFGFQSVIRVAHALERAVVHCRIGLGHKLARPLRLGVLQRTHQERASGRHDGSDAEEHGHPSQAEDADMIIRRRRTWSTLARC
jgi:hypothetical protein